MSDGGWYPCGGQDGGGGVGTRHVASRVCTRLLVNRVPEATRKRERIGDIIVDLNKGRIGVDLQRTFYEEVVPLRVRRRRNSGRQTDRVLNGRIVEDSLALGLRVGLMILVQTDDPAQWPARTTVEARLPRKEFLLEIECVALA